MELDLGAGHLQLGAGGTEQMLSGRVQTLAGTETLTRTTTAEDGAMVYRLVSDAPKAVREPPRWPEWTPDVNPNVPTALHVRGGMGLSELDLGTLNVTELKLEAETGRYTVVFPNQGRVDTTVAGGVSRTTLIVPSDVALELTMQRRGAGHIKFG